MTKDSEVRQTNSGVSSAGEETRNGLEQVDDPIIIKGGSVLLSFDQNFEEQNPSGQSRVFSHKKSPNLVTLKIFRAGTVTNFALQPTDSIKICYDNTNCTEIAP